MIQVTKARTSVEMPADTLDSLKDEFMQRHFVRLPGFLSQDMLDVVRDSVAHGSFYERVHQIGPNKELCLESNAAVASLLLLMNDEVLFRVIQQITDCGPIRSFEGRIYRVYAGKGHVDAWHDDLREDRLLGMSINLSEENYAGGCLQMRLRNSHEIFAEAKNQGAGDAVLFRLSGQLEHRITEVTSAAPKTAFAGWFRGKGKLSELLKSTP